MPLTDEDALEALRCALSFPTVASSDPAATDHGPFEALIAALAARFPRLHEAAAPTRLASDALLFHWRGRSSEHPVVLMAHLDVVPINPDDAWTHPPFDGVVENGVIWGRGTLDCKGSAVAICAAAERLLESGHVPARDIWLSFGCDEEVSGDAAPAAVDELLRRGVEPWFVLDEGGTLASDAFPGVDRPLAVIGVTEKGIVDLELHATSTGGHASMPPAMGATERLARAITRLRRRPFPARIPEPTLEMLRIVSDHAHGPLALATRHATRLRRPLARAFTRLGPETAAMARTTTAVTELRGSPAANVLATTASATVNMRVMAGESVASAVERVRRVVDDDEVTVTVRSADEPSPLSPTDDAAYRLIADTVAEVMPDAVAVPYVMMAATDARHFHRVWPRVYRFTPFRMTPSQRESLHNVDERLEVSSFVEGIRWYRRLIESL